MKYIFYLFLCATIANSCSQVDKFTMFEMSYESNISIPPTTAINLPIVVFTPDMTTESESEFEINDTRKDLVESITLQELTFTLTSPQDEDFSFLKSIRVFISADGIPEEQIAFKDPVEDSNKNTLSLDLSDANLQQFIIQDIFSLRVQTITGELFTAAHEIDINTVFFVDAKILGQ